VEELDLLESMGTTNSKNGGQVGFRLLDRCSQSQGTLSVRIDQHFESETGGELSSFAAPPEDDPYDDEDIDDDAVSFVDDDVNEKHRRGVSVRSSQKAVAEQHHRAEGANRSVGGSDKKKERKARLCFLVRTAANAAFAWSSTFFLAGYVCVWLFLGISSTFACEQSLDPALACPSLLLLVSSSSVPGFVEWRGQCVEWTEVERFVEDSESTVPIELSLQLIRESVEQQSFWLTAAGELRGCYSSSERVFFVFLHWLWPIIVFLLGLVGISSHEEKESEMANYIFDLMFSTDRKPSALEHIVQFLFGSGEVGPSREMEINLDELQDKEKKKENEKSACDKRRKTLIKKMACAKAELEEWRDAKKNGVMPRKNGAMPRTIWRSRSSRKRKRKA